jgi:hypothetical protein
MEGDAAVEVEAFGIVFAVGVVDSDRKVCAEKVMSASSFAVDGEVDFETSDVKVNVIGTFDQDELKLNTKLAT